MVRAADPDSFRYREGPIVWSDNIDNHLWLLIIGNIGETLGSLAMGSSANTALGLRPWAVFADDPMPRLPRVSPIFPIISSHKWLSILSNHTIGPFPVAKSVRIRRPIHLSNSQFAFIAGYISNLLDSVETQSQIRFSEL